LPIGPDSKHPVHRLMKSLHLFFPRAGRSGSYPQLTGELVALPRYREITFRFVSVAFTLMLILLGIWHLLVDRSGLGVMTIILSIPLLWHCWMQLIFGKSLLSPAAMFSIVGLALVVSFYFGDASTLYWAPVLIVAFHFVLERKVALRFNSLFLVLLIPAAWFALSGSNLLMFLLSQVFIGVLTGVFNWVVFRQEQKLQQVAVRDPLTQAFNRRSMMERLEHTIQLHQRYDTVASLMLLDLDHFKKVNDQLGHNVGDSALKEVVRLLHQRLRRTDVLFRYGGEEFVVLLAATEAPVALQLAQQCCRLIREARILPRRTLTVSCGVAEIVAGESELAWLERCDKALYRAKNGGRNQARLAAGGTVSMS
jgi:diguanylate cyclase (GGDEF)-like protein